MQAGGYFVQILEGRNDLGGVWYDNYEGAGLQSRYTHYNMPDYEFPMGTKMLPGQEEVKRYLEGYVEKFALRDLIRFNAKVAAIDQGGSGQWTVRLDSGEILLYDFLILCTGAYHIPFTPSLPGLSSFSGTVLHSSDCKGSVLGSAFSNKRVLVIGGQKSAFDILKLAGECHASSVTGLMREIHWSIPAHLKICGKRIGYYLYTRAVGLLLPQVEGRLSLWEWVKKPLMWAYWKWLELMLAWELPKELVPTTSLLDDRLTQIMTRDESFTQRVRTGQATIIRGSVSHFTPTGPVLSTSQQLLEVDTVVFATGFVRNYLGLERGEGEEGEDKDGLWAYRNVVVPGKTALAIVGISQPLYTMLHTNLQAVWLREVLKGKVQLPSFSEMAQSLARKRKRIRAQLKTPKRSYVWCGSDLNDLLLEDLCLPPIQTGWKEHWFGLPNPKHYESIVTQR